jgi:uncharacterized cofD-like protein
VSEINHGKLATAAHELSPAYSAGKAGYSERGRLIEFPHSDASGLRVVCMGGGTGLSTLLRGLKRHVYLKGEPHPRGTYIASLSAAVAVSDDGGSSGKLRRDFKMLSPGDLRSCLVALSENEALLSQLFQFRFAADSTLDGHSLGNLLLTALYQITGDFGRAVALCAELLSTRGSLYPSTADDVHLEAVMEDGSILRGETVIHSSRKRIVEVMLAPPHAAPSPELLQAIEDADLVAIGPGSLYTSLVPNLLVCGVAEAIAASRAVKVYICNLMTEANESLGLTASGHVHTLYKHAGSPVFSHALVNCRPVSAELLARYHSEGAEQIVADLDEIAALGVTPVMGDFLDEESGVARHAPERIASALLGLAATGRAIHTGLAVRVA